MGRVAKLLKRGSSLSRGSRRARRAAVLVVHRHNVSVSGNGNVVRDTLSAMRRDVRTAADSASPSRVALTTS
jgi:hypothetical protein